MPRPPPRSPRPCGSRAPPPRRPRPRPPGAAAPRPGPGTPPGPRRRGRVLERQGHFAEAETALRHAIRLHPEDLSAHLGLAAGLRRESRWAAEAETYRCALRLRPDDPDLHYDLGLARSAQGLDAAAGAALRPGVAPPPRAARP